MGPAGRVQAQERREGTPSKAHALPVPRQGSHSRTCQKPPHRTDSLQAAGTAPQRKLPPHLPPQSVGTAAVPWAGCAAGSGASWEGARPRRSWTKWGCPQPRTARQAAGRCREAGRGVHGRACVRGIACSTGAPVAGKASPLRAGTGSGRVMRTAQHAAGPPSTPGRKRSRAAAGAAAGVLSAMACGMGVCRHDSRARGPFAGRAYHIRAAHKRHMLCTVWPIQDMCQRQMACLSHLSEANGPGNWPVSGPAEYIQERAVET